MANISKAVFDKYITQNTPCSIFHPWEGNCLLAYKILTINSIIGCTKVFLPIYMIKLILNWNKVNKSYLARIILSYFRSVGYLSSSYIICHFVLCLFSRFYMNYYIFIVAAFCVSSLTTLIESQQRRDVDAFLLFNQVLLLLVNYLTSRGIIKKTIKTETMVFMAVAPILMYLFKTRKSTHKITHMWFYPEKSVFSNGELENPECYHEDTCLKFCYKGFFKYFAVGYSVEIIRRIIPKLFHLCNYPRYMVNLLLSIDNMKMGLFFGSYVAIYRLLSCYLKKLDGKYYPRHTLISAFFASTTYCLKPNIQLLTVGGATLLQLLWERIPYKLNTPDLMTFSNVVLVLSCSILTHYYMFGHDISPKITKKSFEIATNGIMKQTPRFISYLLQDAQNS